MSGDRPAVPTGGWRGSGTDSVGGSRPDLEDVACDICGGRETIPVLRAHDFRYALPGIFTVVRCLRCSLAYTNPRPAGESLARYYPAEYASHAALRPEHASRAGEALRRRLVRGNGTGERLLARAYNALAFRAFVPSPSAGRLLDVGCGRGAYLAAWQRLGWEVEGVEPSEGAAEVARNATGATIHQGFFEDIDLPECHYDLVTLVHCLEHSRSPRRMLRLVRRVLRPGGRVLIMVPNFASVGRHLFGSRWYGLEVPRHLVHFEPRTLREALRLEGFERISVAGSQQPDVPWRSLRLALGVPAHNDRGTGIVRLVGHLALLPFTLLRRSTNLWAVARKPI